MNDVTRTRVIELAKRDAELYVREFDEPLNPGATDWDTVQWSNHCRTELTDLSSGGIREYWSIYQLTLVTETRELCGLFRKRSRRLQKHAGLRRGRAVTSETPGLTMRPGCRKTPRTTLRVWRTFPVCAIVRRNHVASWYTILAPPASSEPR